MPPAIPACQGVVREARSISDAIFDEGPSRNGSINGDDPELQTVSRRLSVYDTMSHHSKGGVLHPHSRYRYYWDMATMVFMMWVVVDVPFMVAFDVEVKPHVWDWHRILAFVVDVFFMSDVVLNFNTGVELPNGTVSMNRAVIAKDYLKVRCQKKLGEGGCWFFGVWS